MSDAAQVELIQPRPIKVGRKSNLLPPDQRKKSKIGLSFKEKAFINHYLSGKSALKSAKLAGYADTTANVASVLLVRKPKIAAEIERRTKQNLQDITSDRIQQETAKLAFSNIMDYIRVLPNGTFEVDFHQVDRDLGSAIQEVGYDVQGRPKIRLVDKKASLELLGRFKKMLSDKAPGFGGDGDGQPLTIERLDAIVHQNVTINQQFNINTREEADLLLEQ